MSVEAKDKKQNKWKFLALLENMISPGERLFQTEKMSGKPVRILVSIVFTTLVLGICTGFAFIMFNNAGDSSANIALIYTLGLIFTTLNTTGYCFGLIFAVLSVICINYFFSFPYFEPNFTISGYPITFLVMLIIFTVTSTITS